MNMQSTNYQIKTIEETNELIQSGNYLVVSGEEDILKQLAKGNWIGATMPYFYIENEKGRNEKEKVFVFDYTKLGVEFKIESYDRKTLPLIYQQGFSNGFNFIILPALSDIHLDFALESLNYPDIFSNPLIGLVAGADLDEFNKGRKAKTFMGKTLSISEDKAVAIHVRLEESKVARLEIINVFEQQDTPVFEFFDDSFVVKDCLINGEKKNLYDYIKQNNYDVQYPLISDYAGALINVSFQKTDSKNKEVIFYAPVFKDKKYYPAKKIDSYADLFKEKLQNLQEDKTKIVFNCNCVLNFTYGNLENNEIGFSGVATFGEIAYQLLNQTFTYLVIDDH